MCELLGMSANVPTDIVFSFTGFQVRGGKRGPHKDGWGIAFYEGKGVRVFLDVSPSSESEVARFVRRYPIKSTAVISHIRKASVGRVTLENTHPFVRELWGKYWVFAHNGRIPKVKKRALEFHRPVGATDSEHAFCWVLDRLREAFPTPPDHASAYWPLLGELFTDLSGHGTFNALLSEGECLYAFADTKLHWIQRKAPFSRARLLDEDVEVDFSKETTPKDRVAVIATTPLTVNETWNRCAKNELAVFAGGERAA
ncbi:MAG: class II glutamine amidotransferase [Deltaproteobacteria bacterium RBG_13_65_10]|nr:MAG: class II glutamine amidotransferase [Deltaproteobacteria bacterium RBG_13_65_10]